MPKRNMQNAACAARKRTAKKVWRIFHFEQRFEMDHYRRQGGLDYVRMFVTATTADKSNESTGFIQQLAELEHYYPDERDAYEGRFWRLCRLTATQEDWLRGFLLDSGQEPLSEAKIAARLHLKLPIMKKTLAALRKVGLIERIDCPVFEKPKKEKSKSEKEKATGRARKAKTQKAKNMGQAAASAGNSETFQNVSESFKNRTKSNKNKLITKEMEFEEQRARQKAMLAGEPTQEDRQERPTASAPASSPSISSTKTDEPEQAAGNCTAEQYPEPARPPDNHIGNIIQLNQHRYTPDSLEFAYEVMLALGDLSPAQLDEIRQGTYELTRKQYCERGCWSSAWAEAASEFPSETMAKLRAQLLKRAPTSLRQAPSKGIAPAKYLRKCWANLVIDMRRRKDPPRAGPA